MKPVEETADLDSLLVMGHEAGEVGRRTSARLIGTLLVATAIAVAISGATVVLARTAFARPADVIFVTPNAPAASPAPSAVPDGSQADPVAPSATDQADPVPSQDAPSQEVPSQDVPGQDMPGSDLPATTADPGQVGQPSGDAPGHLDDGLFVGPSQHPDSNG